MNRSVCCQAFGASKCAIRLRNLRTAAPLFGLLRVEPSATSVPKRNFKDINAGLPARARHPCLGATGVGASRQRTHDARVAYRDWTSARDLLPKALLDLAQRTGRAGQLAPLWESAVGSSIAKRCQVSAWRGGVVTFLVPERSWLDELRRREPELRQRLEQVLGPHTVNRLEFELCR